VSDNTLDGDDIDGLLIDIDGVLTVSWEPIEGAPNALATIRRSGLPLRFATNTTTRTRAEVADLLGQAGMAVDVAEILTAPAATAAHLRRNHPGARVFLLNTGDLTADLEDIDLVDDGPADVVVIGGAGVDFTHRQLNEAFRLILDGAAFVAMHRNLYWRTRDGLELDTGYERLTAADAVFLRIETPHEPQHVGSLSVLEGAPLRGDDGRLRFDDLQATSPDACTASPAAPAGDGGALQPGPPGVGRRRPLRHRLPRPPHRASPPGRRRLSSLR
jgi:hypothetical protein